MNFAFWERRQKPFNLIAFLFLFIFISKSGLFAKTETESDGMEDANRNKRILREQTTGIMGSPLKISVIGVDKEKLDQAIDAAIKEMHRIEDLMTDWRPSPLTVVNDSAGLGPIPVDSELLIAIAHGIEMGRLTDGAFDITYAGVGKLWSFKRDAPVFPPVSEVLKALQFVDFQKIKINLENKSIELPQKMRIGLGGIAKGYGVDRAMAMLMKHGVKHAIVNAGGDMKVLGKNFDTPWEIAIKHPRDRNRAMASIRLSNTCLVTSGDYERFFEKDGKRFHHIIDPRTGYPSEGCLSASVVAPDAEYADALATALCVIGPEKGLKIVEKLPRVEAILVGMDGLVLPSSGLVGAIKKDF